MFFIDTAECLEHIIRKWETAVVSRFNRHIFAHRAMFRKCLQPVPLLLEIMRSPFLSPTAWKKEIERKKPSAHKKLRVYKSRKTYHYLIIKNQSSKWILRNPNTEVLQDLHIFSLPFISNSCLPIITFIHAFDFLKFLKIL